MDLELAVRSGLQNHDSVRRNSLTQPSTIGSNGQAVQAGSTSEQQGRRDRQACIICASCFVIVFTACGTLFSFGVYQELYESMANTPGTPFYNASPAMIDLIGTLSAAFMTIGAPISSAWTKRFSPRRIVITGGILFFLGSVLASVSTRLWQFQLTQGLLAGIAIGFCYMPPVTVAPTWFASRRGLAMGIIMSGTGVGGLVWAPVIQAFNASFGYRNALRVSGGITSALIVAGGLFIEWDPVSKTKYAEENARLAQRPHSLLRKLWEIPLIDWRIAKSRKFCAQILSGSLQAGAYYTPVFFFSAYARTLGYSPAAGARFIAINNMCNAVGKIIIGFAADRYGRINVLLLSTAISALGSLIFWLPSTQVTALASGRGLFIAYSIVYGFFASPYVSLFPTTLVEVFGIQYFASVNGALYMARGLATLVGTPVAGALIKHNGVAGMVMPEGYLGMTIFISLLLGGAAGGVWWIRWESKQT